MILSRQKGLDHTVVAWRIWGKKLFGKKPCFPPCYMAKYILSCQFLINIYWLKKKHTNYSPKCLAFNNIPLHNPTKRKYLGIIFQNIYLSPINKHKHTFQMQENSLNYLNKMGVGRMFEKYWKMTWKLLEFLNENHYWLKNF